MSVPMLLARGPPAIPPTAEPIMPPKSAPLKADVPVVVPQEVSMRRLLTISVSIFFIFLNVLSLFQFRDGAVLFELQDGLL